MPTPAAPTNNPVNNLTNLNQLTETTNRKLVAGFRTKGEGTNKDRDAPKDHRQTPILAPTPCQ